MRIPHLLAAIAILIAAAVFYKGAEDTGPTGTGAASLRRTAQPRATDPGSAASPAVSRSAARPGSSEIESSSSSGAAPGNAVSTAPEYAAPVAPVVRRRFTPPPTAARLPLVFALPPEEMPGLNPRQFAAAVAIADQFYETIGGETADPSTPDYRDRWRREQPLADYQLRAAIGAQAYARYQEEAYHRARSSTAAPPGP